MNPFGSLVLRTSQSHCDSTDPPWQLGLGSKIWGLGFRFFRVKDLGFRALGSGLPALCLGCKAKEEAQSALERVERLGPRTQAADIGV